VPINLGLIRHLRPTYHWPPE